MDDEVAAMDGGISEEEGSGSVRGALDAAWAEAVSASNEFEPEVEAELPESTTEKVSTDKLATKEAEAAVPPIVPPKSWSKEASNHFASLPRELQEFISKRELEREGDYTSKTQQLARERALIQAEIGKLGPVANLFRERMPDFHARGVDPAAWVNQALAIDQMARQDKRAALAHLAQQWGVDPRELAQAQQQQTQQPQLPPQYARAIQAQQQKLQQLEQKLTAKEQAEQQARYSRAEQEVQAFAQDQEAHPHYQAVEKLMTTFAAQMVKERPDTPMKEILQDAYDRATWATPEIRAQILESQGKEKEVREREEAAKRVAAAKKAGSPVNGAPNGKMSTSASSLREELEANWDKLTQ